MKWSRITKYGSISLASGLITAYGARWIYRHALQEDPKYTLVCGSIVAVSWAIALIGACTCTLVAARNGIRQSKAGRRLKRMKENSEPQNGQISSESEHCASSDEVSS